MKLTLTQVWLGCITVVLATVAGCGPNQQCWEPFKPANLPFHTKADVRSDKSVNARSQGQKTDGDKKFDLKAAASPAKQATIVAVADEKSSTADKKQQSKQVAASASTAKKATAPASDALAKSDPLTAPEEYTRKPVFLPDEIKTKETAKSKAVAKPVKLEAKVNEKSKKTSTATAKVEVKKADVRTVPAHAVRTNPAQAANRNPVVPPTNAALAVGSVAKSAPGNAVVPAAAEPAIQSVNENVPSKSNGAGEATTQAKTDEIPSTPRMPVLLPALPPPPFIFRKPAMQMVVSAKTTKEGPVRSGIADAPFDAAPLYSFGAARLSSMEIEKRVRAVCGDDAREVLVDGQGDGTLRVRVTTANESLGKFLVKKLTAVLNASWVRVDVYVQP